MDKKEYRNMQLESGIPPFVAGMALAFILAAILMLTACAPIEPLPTLEPLPTYTDVPPQATFTPLPTHTPYPTITPLPTDAIPTDTPLPTIPPPTDEPPIIVRVKVAKILAREVCYNVNGYIYNNKGFPVLSDCIYPKGDIAARLKFYQGSKVEVEPYGNMLYAQVHGGTYNLKPTIKADGGETYYVLTTRGVDGQLLFIQAWNVSVIQ